MTDYVVPTLADAQTLTGTVGGETAWLAEEKRLAILSETGGDWLPILSAGALWTGHASYGDLAANASQDIIVNFPAGLFTQPPVVTVSPFGTRLTVGVKSVSTTQAVIRMSNFSGVASADGTRQLQITAIQQF